MDLEALKRKEIEEIDQFFGAIQGRREWVEVYFENSFSVIEHVKARLEGQGSLEKVNERWYKFEGEILGCMNFLAWIRRFGSSAIIAKPNWLKDKQIQYMQNLKKLYGE